MGLVLMRKQVRAGSAGIRKKKQISATAGRSRSANATGAQKLRQVGSG